MYQLLWTAPEFLREAKFTNFMTVPSLASILTSPSFESTSVSHSNYKAIIASVSQKGDVYSFAFILYEIMGRQGPWGRGYMTSSEAACKFYKVKKCLYWYFTKLKLVFCSYTKQIEATWYFWRNSTVFGGKLNFLLT